MERRVAKFGSVEFIGLSSGKKAVLILDQFEQWLHAKRGLTNQEHPAALRQCDGERVQCLIGQ